MSGSVLGKRWLVRDPDADAPASPADLMVRLLRLRGISSRADARVFLRPELPEELDLPNIDLAVERLSRAIAEGERIAVYGDYDADGITATALLVEGITDLGGRAVPYIPDRFGEGYGLNTTALHALIDHGAQLVVAVDTGTSAVDEVAYANEHSLDVLVLDHHTPKDAGLPDAAAVVNPHLPGTPEAFRYLSGCGVAFVVLAALARHLGHEFDPDRYLDLVAIGAVCDVVPLVGANRAAVLRGLHQIDRRTRPGLAALLNAARFQGTPSAHTLAFVVGPRLNAAGRLDHGLKSYDLLRTRDEAEARALAVELEELNRRRQTLTAEAVALFRDLARAECGGAPLIMVGHPDVGSGIVGLVAARLADEHFRPAIVFRRGPEYSTGSARSISGFDIHEALAQGSHLMERFGGHQQAGGFTVRTERVEELRELLTAWAAGQQDWTAVVPSLTVDLTLTPSAGLTLGQARSVIRQLEPCGNGNETPLFLTRAARVRETSVTRDGRHLRLRLDAGPGHRPWPAIAFDMAAHRPRLGQSLDLVYQITDDRYGDPQMRVLDLAPAG